MRRKGEETKLKKISGKEQKTGLNSQLQLVFFGFHPPFFVRKIMEISFQGKEITNSYNTYRTNHSLHPTTQFPHFLPFH